MDSTIYFFAGSEVCLNVMPVLAVVSSSCGTGRPLHLADLAPGGGGGGVGCPPCAAAMFAARNISMRVFAKRLRPGVFNWFLWQLGLMDAGLPEWRRGRDRAAWLLIPCKSPARGQHRQSGIPCGKQPAIDNACSHFGGSVELRSQDVARHPPICRDPAGSCLTHTGRWRDPDEQRALPETRLAPQGLAIAADKQIRDCISRRHRWDLAPVPRETPRPLRASVRILPPLGRRNSEP